MSKERRCYKCAKRNHRAAECRTSRWLKCAKCSGRHATGVCELNQRAAPLPSSEGASEAGVTVQSSLQVERTQEKARVLLQTARAFAEGENKTALVRLLLDGGSQRTFILEEVSRRLKLHIIGEERLTIYAFGSQRPLEERRCRRVECWLKNWRDNTRVRVEALEIPEISGDLLPPPDDRVAHFVREQGLVLADTVPDGYQPGVGIELLVGADHYWDVTTGSVKRVNERLVAVETVLGWVLQGTDTTSVVAVDMRGCGLSSRPRQVEDYLMSRMVDDVQKLILSLGRKKAIVVGHDLGGMVAWVLATKHEDMVDRLVVINGPHPLAFRYQLENSFAQMLKSWSVTALF
ncbi:hypothetical protein MTO96_038295 [Rhipicephalus appendiculatus]